MSETAGADPFGRLPDSAFMAPDGSNRDAVNDLLERALARIVALSASAGSRSPMPTQPALEVAPTIPESGRPEEDVLRDMESLLLGSMNPASPGYMAHMDSLPATFSVIGDLAAASVNNNLLSVELAPAFTRLEIALTREFAAMFGLGSKAGGLMTAGGSLANLHAVAVARNKRFGVHDGGIAPLGVEAVILASEAVHTSFRKAAMLLGLGSHAVELVPTDEFGRIDVPALEARIASVRVEGRAPFCVVGIAGTTVTGNIDPLPELAEIAAREALWFHVDAAYGGALAFSPRERERLRGIELADSVTFNPQKWMYVAKTCAMVLFRDMDVVEEEFEIGKPYFSSAPDARNLGEIGIQGTRTPDVLKLWLTLQHIGADGYADIIDRTNDTARRFLAEVEARPVLRLASPPEMNIICFRAEPAGMAPDEQDVLNADLRRFLQSEGFFLSLPHYRGQRWLRSVLLNPFISAEQVGTLFEALDRFLEPGP
jgi:glutamate/tyrosine decarboxylase-like PLP-dependent enzyme